MWEIPQNRSSLHTAELQRIEKQVTECPKCGGTGISKKLMRHRITSFAAEQISKNQERKTKNLREKARLYAVRNKENVNNPSYGLCECRIEADLRRQLVIGNLPQSLASAKYADIITRDITIQGHSHAPLRKFIRFYAHSFAKAKTNSIGCNFFGGYGKGKTFASTFLAAQVAKCRYSVHYIPFFALIDLVNTNIFVNQLLNEILDVDLLVVDDIGNEQMGRRNASGEIAFLLKQRHRRNKPTIFIFNELRARAEIKEVYGPAFYNVCAESNMDILFKTSVSDEKTGKANIAKLLRRLG